MNFEREHLWQYAEDYLNGRLSAETTHRLFTYLESDEKLMQEWSSHISLLKTLQDMADDQAQRKAISSIHKEFTQNTPRQASITFNPTYTRWAKNIAAVLTIAIISSYFTTQYFIKDTTESQSNEFISLKRDIQHIKNSQEQLKQTIDDKEQEKNIIINNENISGTGFAISNEGYLVTDYHVIDKADSIFIKINEDDVKKAYLIAFDVHSDIAILKVEDNKFKFTSTDLPYHLNNKTSPIAQSIYSIGYPQDKVFYSEGYISSHMGVNGSTDQYQLELPANPGQSGSPIFDQNGEVIGMLLGKKVYATYAVKSSSIIGLIESLPKDHKIKLPTKNNLKGLQRTEQVKKANEFVFPVLVFKSK